MPLSRRAALAQGIVDRLNSEWSTKPASVEIVRDTSYEHLITELSADDKAAVGVIVPEVKTDPATRTSDFTVAPVFVVVLALLNGNSNEDLDPWDLATETCHDILRPLNIVGDWN